MALMDHFLLAVLQFTGTGLFVMGAIMYLLCVCYSLLYICGSLYIDFSLVISKLLFISTAIMKKTLAKK